MPVFPLLGDVFGLPSGTRNAAENRSRRVLTGSRQQRILIYASAGSPGRQGPGVGQQPSTTTRGDPDG